MGIQEHGNFVHWNYYIALEQDLAKVSRFIEFSQANRMIVAFPISVSPVILPSSIFTVKCCAHLSFLG